jgi:peptidoglycan/LPS O-acetylase OafA/YrhL
MLLQLFTELQKMNEKVTTDLLSSKIKSLDGFRGLAILMVIGYHYLHFFTFGWAGVDLFFVLSGFLITGKLVESLNANNYFSSFFLKRILRIVPLYYSVLLVFFVIIPFFFPAMVSYSFKLLLEQKLYYWFFTANLYDAARGWPLNVTLIHFWSLACEMQFYLLWPFIIYFFYSKGKWIVAVLMFFCIAALAFRIWGQPITGLNDIYRYVLLPCRLDAFSAGALLYIFFRKGWAVPHAARLFFLALLTLGFILLIMAVKQIPWHYGVAFVEKFGYTLNAIFWVTLIAVVLKPGQASWKRIFTNPVMTGLGKYSYGLYVFHWPVYIIISRQFISNSGTEDKTWLPAMVAFLVTCICSFASYHLMEKHFLKLKPAN